MTFAGIKSINVLDNERVLMDQSSAPAEIHLPGGATLRPVFSRGHIVSASATDREGAPLDTFFLAFYRPVGDHLQERLASEHSDCAVCVCYADGGCKCIPIPCPPVRPR